MPKSQPQPAGSATNPYEPSRVAAGPPLAPSSTAAGLVLPPLMKDPSFWGMNATQFLGAFNDNLFKQTLLLIATPAAAAAAAGDGEDKQSLAMIVFAAAFLLLSGIAGWLADRTSKRTLIIGSKIAEVLVMTLGLVGFLMWEQFGLAGMFVVLFLMGAQSAFFGPPKYGILPEMLHDRDLPRANGIFLMFTFLAIIFGTVVVTIFGASPDTAWRPALFCIFIAVLGVGTSLLVRRVPVANPGAKLRPADLFVSPEMFRLVLRDRELLLALLVTSSFWMLGGVVTQGVNALGKTQLDLKEFTSLLAAMLGVGIPIGCVVGGQLSRSSINPRVVTAGAVGMVVCLLLMAAPFGPQNHMLGFWGSIPVLIVLGFFTGMFVVPIQVSLQVRPPAADKGRMIGLMNQVNWLGIIAGAVLYHFAIRLLEADNLPRCLIFLVPAAIMAPIALFYRPEELRLGD